MSAKNIPIPQGKYIPANRYGNIIYSAGMTPRDNGKLIMSGKVVATQDVEYYKVAARLATANALTAIESLVGEQEKLVKILTMTVYVNAEEGYTEHAKLADLASDFLCEQLGAAGIVSRAAIGVASLPGNAPLEIQLVAAAE